MIQQEHEILPTPPTILISYFFGSDQIPLGESCAQALEDLGANVIRFNSAIISPINHTIFRHTTKICRLLGLNEPQAFNQSKWGKENYMRNHLENLIKKHSPNILFMIRGDLIDANFLLDLKEKYKIETLVGWWVKGTKHFELCENECNKFDIYYCSHREITNNSINYLPVFGVDRRLYHKITPPPTQTRDICFVGRWTEHRENYIKYLINQNIIIYGPLWKKKNQSNTQLRNKIANKGIWGTALNQLYNSTKIILNISTWDTTKLSGLNMRIFDVPASGGFLLTDYSDDLLEYFKIGEEIETFQTAEEMNDKITYYLTHENARKRIAQKGYEKVLTYCDFTRKMGSILNDIKELNEKKTAP